MDRKLISDYQKEIGAPFEDTLTGLFTHDFFQLALEREIDRAKRYGTEFTVALVDVDHLAAFNERHGTLKGNLLLRKIAALIKENVRQTDLAARYAGGSFALILAGTLPVGASRVLERIQRVIADLTNNEITVSIGMSAWPQDADTKKELLERTAAALDQARTQGPNSLFFFDAIHTPTSDSDQPSVLLVGDEPLNLKLMEALMVSLKYNVLKAASGLEALDITAGTDVDVVLLDVKMPEMDGFELCRRIKAKGRTRMIPVVLVTALEDTDAKIKGIESGVDDFITKPPNLTELRARTNSLIRIKKLNSNLASIETVLFSLANAVEAKCAHTQGHIARVSTMAVQLGRKMGLSSVELEALRFGGALHDIGKIGISEAILNKSDPLNPDEMRVMQTHPIVGYRICLPLEKNLGAALDIVRSHHEKMDGSGYPDGISGDEISMVARIMAVADIHDALTTDRPYRQGFAPKKAINILSGEAEAGKLDKTVVAALIDMMMG